MLRIKNNKVIIWLCFKYWSMWWYVKAPYKLNQHLIWFDENYTTKWYICVYDEEWLLHYINMLMLWEFYEYIKD